MFVALSQTFRVDGGDILELLEQGIFGNRGGKPRIGKAPLNVVWKRRVAKLGESMIEN